MLILAAPTIGAECGGKNECRCGDRVVRDTRLSRSLGPCRADGLTVAKGVVLDGNGHALRGAGTKGSAGIRLPSGSTDAVVRNLEVTRFERGIRFLGVRGARVEGGEVHHNGDVRRRKGYGIDLADGASGNTVIGTKIHSNADEGLHVGTGANENRFRDLKVWGNGRENVYFLGNSGNRFEGGELGASGEASVYIKNARATRLSDVSLKEGIVQIRGSSSGTMLSALRIAEGSIVVEPYRGRGGPPGTPTGTRIEGGSIAGSGTCLRLDGATDTILRGTRLDCHPELRIGGGADLKAEGLVAARIRCGGTGRVTGLVASRLLFLDSDGAPAAGVRVLTASGLELGKSDRQGRIAGSIPAWELVCPARVERRVRLSAKYGDWTRPVAAGDTVAVVVSD